MGAYLIRSGKFTPVTVVPMGQPVYFFVFYKVEGTLPATLTGHVTVQQRCGPPTTFSLKPVKGVDRAYFAGVFAEDRPSGPRDGNVHSHGGRAPRQPAAQLHARKHLERRIRLATF